MLQRDRTTDYSMCEWQLKPNLSMFVVASFFFSFFRLCVFFFLGREIRKRPAQMARRLEEERHGSWASTWRNPTGDSCSVAGASLTSFSQSVTPFPPGLWGCTLLPASLCPELL